MVPEAIIQGLTGDNWEWRTLLRGCGCKVGVPTVEDIVNEFQGSVLGDLKFRS